MARIAKSDVYAAFDQAAALIKAADAGHDGRISRDDLANELRGLTGTQHELVDIFYKFIDHRDYKAYAKVTGADVDAAVAYAKQHMLANYDVNGNGLSKAEFSKLSTTAKFAVQLAQENKAVAAGKSPGEIVTWG
jgi:hypothetical protein